MNIEELRNLRKLLNQPYYVINALNPNESINEEQERMNIIQLDCSRESTIKFVRNGVKLLEKVLMKNPTVETMNFQIKLAFLADEQLTPFCINNMHFLDDVMLVSFQVSVPKEIGSSNFVDYDLMDFGLSTTTNYVPVNYQAFIHELYMQGYEFDLPDSLSTYTSRFIDTCKMAPVVDNKLANAMRRARGESAISDFGFDFSKMDLSPFSPTMKINLIDEKVV